MHFLEQMTCKLQLKCICMKRGRLDHSISIVVSLLSATIQEVHGAFPAKLDGATVEMYDLP